MSKKVTINILNAILNAPVRGTVGGTLAAAGRNAARAFFEETYPAAPTAAEEARRQKALRRAEEVGAGAVALAKGAEVLNLLTRYGRGAWAREVYEGRRQEAREGLMKLLSNNERVRAEGWRMAAVCGRENSLRMETLWVAIQEILDRRPEGVVVEERCVEPSEFDAELQEALRKANASLN